MLATRKIHRNSEDGTDVPYRNFVKMTVKKHNTKQPRRALFSCTMRRKTVIMQYWIW